MCCNTAFKWTCLLRVWEYLVQITCLPLVPFTILSDSSLYGRGLCPWKRHLPGSLDIWILARSQLIEGSSRRLKSGRREKPEYFSVLSACSEVATSPSCFLSPFLVIPTLWGCLCSQDIVASCLCSSIHECCRDFWLLLISVLIHSHLFGLSALSTLLQLVSWQGCPTHGPWAAFGPGWLWMWPNTKSYIYLKPFFCSSVFISVCVFNVWPKATLLPLWPRDAKRLDTPANTFLLLNYCAWLTLDWPMP